MAEPRTPRNTTRAFQEDPAEPLLLLAEAMATGSAESSILRQEADGQREMVNSDALPSDLHSPEEEFTRLGFVFGDPVEGDPMFRHATLPPGWRREPSDHSMWSYLVDGDGYRRAEIFYKAAFYDRSAFMHLSTVYSYISTCLYEKTVPEVCGDWATREAVLAALEEQRAYHADKVSFWTEHGRAEYVREHSADVELCDRFREALTGEGAS